MKRLLLTVLLACAAFTATTVPVSEADEGRRIDVSGHFRSRFSMRPPYNPCTAEPHTRFVFDKVEGDTRDDKERRQDTTQVTYNALAVDGWEVQATATLTEGVDVTVRLPDGSPDTDSKLEGVESTTFYEAGAEVLAGYEPKEQRFRELCYLADGFEQPVDEDGDPVVPRPALFIVHDDEVWIPIVTRAELELEMWLLLSAYLQPPNLDFKFKDPDTGWQIVKVPSEILVDNLTPIALTAHVENETGSIDLFIRAEPRHLTFVSGDYGPARRRLTAECEWAQVVAERCLFEYRNSSAVEDDLTFETFTEVEWAAATTFSNRPQYTYADDAVQVGEFQALTISN